MTTTPPPTPREPNEKGHLVEGPRSLSESMLWGVQDTYYAEKSIGAWASGDVPHVLTTGPMLAHAYARLIAAFADDCAAGRFGAFDPAAPIYVIELGAGTGRLGFEIFTALDNDRATPCPITYVLTDLVAGNVEFWKAHPKLAGFFADGKMDAARFAVGQDTVLHLDSSGVTLAPGSAGNPLVVVSNYLFDVLPQDCFETIGGDLFEEEVALYAREPGVDPSTPDFFRQIFVAPRRIPVRPERYEPAIEALLFEFAREEAVDRRFLFPANGVRGLRALAAIASGRLLHLIGERPGGLPERVPDRDSVDAAIEADPDIPRGPGSIDGGGDEAFRPGALLAMGVHGGSMSLPVEVGILLRSLAAHGSELFLPPSMPAGLLVSAIVAGSTSDPSAVRSTFAHTVADLGPEDVYFTVKAAIEHSDDVVLAMLLGVLRTGGYDPYLFRQVYGSLEKKMKDVDYFGGAELERVLRIIHAHDFPIDESTELAYPMGVLLAQAERFEGALWFFERSTDRSGPRAATLFNVALCHVHLEDPGTALQVLDEAIALDPGYEPAHALIAHIHEERSRRAAEA